MKIAYYTHPAFFEAALSLIPVLAEKVELHLFLEITPTVWQTAGFDLARRRLPSGLVPGDAHLAADFPGAVRDRWRAAASFRLVVHGQPRSIHPASWRLGRKVLRYIREDLHADVLHIDDVDPSPRLAFALAGRVPDPPIVLSVHDPLPHHGETNWRKSVARRLAYPRADRFILHSQALVDDFTQRHLIPPQMVSVAHLGAYDVFRAWQPDLPGCAARTPTVLFFGRLSPYKGLEVLYEAASLVAASLPTVTFVVAGAPVDGYVPPDPPQLPAPASFVEQRRHLANEDLARLFCQASVVVCPYLDATQSGVIAVAQAFGKPIVASRIGGIPEYVREGETGLLVPPGDAVALAAALSRVLTDEDLRSRLARTARQAAAADTWRESAGILSEAYAAVARNRS
jgi:glycosyltransferase involved in cell wall biosynthesis